MRLIEVRQKLSALLDGTIIQVQTEQQFNGYANTILQSNNLFSVLKFISEQPWSDVDFSPIQTIIDKYDALSSKRITVEQTEFDQINSFVSTINQKLPIFLGIVDSLTRQQSPQDLNIKISKNIDSARKLDQLLKEIMEVEKFSNIDGQGLKFDGFDTGSDWMIFTTATSLSYAFVMACLKLAQEVLKTKEQYFKTEGAKLAYTASLNAAKDNKYSDKGFLKYQEDYSEAQLKAGADSIAHEIGQVNGHEIGDIEPKAINTTKSLINIIGNGNEVHLSLSSPKQISEAIDGAVEMNYDYLGDLAKAKAPKSLDAGEKETLPEGNKTHNEQ